MNPRVPTLPPQKAAACPHIGQVTLWLGRVRAWGSVLCAPRAFATLRAGERLISASFCSIGLVAKPAFAVRCSSPRKIREAKVHARAVLVLCVFAVAYGAAADPPKPASAEEI